VNLRGTTSRPVSKRARGLRPARSRVRPGSAEKRAGRTALDNAASVERDVAMHQVSLVAVALSGALLAGCATEGPSLPVPWRQPPVAKSPVPGFTEEVFAQKPMRAYRIPTPEPGKPPVQTVIGEVGSHVVRPNETLLDIARYYDLGMNEIADANPGVDLWTPKVGSRLVVPTSWVLPCCSYDGLTVNVPELRLYYFQRAPGEPGITIVRTYPLGLGRDDRRTPKGNFTVIGKTVNPTWNIPPRIRQDHIRELGDARWSIPGGAPDNPLGKYRFELSLEPYRIHGTNIPWGIGMLISNGCSRLYPEDVEHLFPMVTIGTKGAFIYQPVKVGVRDGQVYVEAHADLYRLGGSMSPNAAATLRSAGVTLQDARVASVLKDAQGMPTRVGTVSEPVSAAQL
jgi:L,D-transpeptidase ErfK/SrfK